MAHHRALSSTSISSTTHPLSLKVLRLSRPSLATQTPLPPTAFGGQNLDIPPTASLIPDTESHFPLTPLLTLPPAFGAAYVGETFACTLCANNEVRDGEGRSISGVRIVAELQTPGDEKGVELELESGAEEMDFGPGATIQRTLRKDLKEEGQYVLAVTVTYTETFLMGSEGTAGGGRVRSFRKLYQFVAQRLIAVRSKVTERKRRGKDEGRLWVLEAQLENVGDTSVVLEKLALSARGGITGSQIGGRGVGGDMKAAVVLKPHDVEQVMFLLKEEGEVAIDDTERVSLAQLAVHWRSAMGERGSLSTGWLASRRS